MLYPVMSRATLAGLAILWIACLVVISVGRTVPHAPHGSMFHGPEHAVAFGILALMLLPLCRNRSQKWVVTLAMVCFAGGLELGQHQIYGQSYEWWDVCDDGIGILPALLLLEFTRIRALLVRGA
jgi:hypothetical protein